jgi:hypothetical protein
VSGDYDAALQLYDEILEANPANLLVMKRKVSATYRLASCQLIHCAHIFP